MCWWRGFELSRTGSNKSQNPTLRSAWPLFDLVLLVSSAIFHASRQSNVSKIWNKYWYQTWWHGLKYHNFYLNVCRLLLYVFIEPHKCDFIKKLKHSYIAIFKLKLINAYTRKWYPAFIYGSPHSVKLSF